MTSAVWCVGQKPLKGKVIRVTWIYENVLEGDPDGKVGRGKLVLTGEKSYPVRRHMDPWVTYETKSHFPALVENPLHLHAHIYKHNHPYFLASLKFHLSTITAIITLYYIVSGMLVHFYN